jgi:hypothetical protein
MEGRAGRLVAGGEENVIGGVRKGVDGVGRGGFEDHVLVFGDSMLHGLVESADEGGWGVDSDCWELTEPADI